MDEETQEIEKENKNLKALEIDKSRAKIRVLQIEKEYNLADLRISGATQKEIEKQQAEEILSLISQKHVVITIDVILLKGMKIPGHNLKFKMMKSQKYLMIDKESNH